MIPLSDELPAGGRTADADRLPCGVRVDDLLHQVADGTPPRDPAHQRQCPHCRAALAELTELWAPVLDLAGEQVRAPAGLLQAVMSQVRELSRGGWSAVLQDGSGQTRIAARVVGAVARLAAESVPHVTLALGGGRRAAPPGGEPELAVVAAAEEATEIGALGRHVAVEVQVVVDYGVPVREVAQQVRDRVIEHLHTQTGLTATEVNVVVVDVRPRPAD